MENTSIKVKDMSLKNSRTTAFEDVSFIIVPGKLTALTGDDLTGRREILLSLAGRMAPTSGFVEVFGFSLPKERSHIRPLVGLAFFNGINDPDPSLSLEALTKAELGLFGLARTTASATRYLQSWGLEHLLEVPLGGLSPEDRARFGIALGCVGEPRMLVVDDIETDLTLTQSKKLMKYLRTLTTGGRTVLVGCKEETLAREAEAVIVLKDAPSNTSEPGGHE